MHSLVGNRKSNVKAKRSKCFCYSRARSLEERGCGMASASRWCRQTPELCLFFILHILVHWPYDCRMQGHCPQVSGHQRGRGKRYREAEDRGRQQESVPFIRRAESSQKPQLVDFSFYLIGWNWAMVPPPSCKKTGEQDWFSLVKEGPIVTPSEIRAL